VVLDRRKVVGAGEDGDRVAAASKAVCKAPGQRAYAAPVEGRVLGGEEGDAQGDFTRAWPSWAALI